MTERPISGRYHLKRSIAGGGMGAIWLALDAQLQRHVAVKLMAAHHLSSPESRQRFAQEAKAIARVHNPHVVQIYDYGIDEGSVPYIVMELLEGEDLAALLERRPRFSPEAVLPLLNQVARALTAAHTAGVIHRDLKPGNIFLARVDGQEVVKVLDFGLALMDASAEPAQGEVAGTPRYMSPEQLRGQPDLDHRTDLWSLAIVLYRMLTGDFPFSPPALELLRQGTASVSATPPSRLVPELGEAMDAFFARALAPELSQRFSSARELATAFSALVETGRPTRAAKVLVVDDEPDMALVMQLLMRKEIQDNVYEFVFASNGEEALEKLRQHPDVEAVMSDLKMPKMDGLTFLGRVGEVNPLAKVIIVSAYGDMGNLRTAMNRGAFDFLVKPINFDDLRSTLEKTLKHVRELRRMLRSTEENDLLRMFVNGGVVERVLSAVRAPLGVAGEKVESTVVFIDVKDFTPLTRGDQPDVAIQRLNANFEVIVPELTSRGGVVDKFVGDAVMAVFRGQGHLGRALDACLSARQQLRALAFRSGGDSPYSHGVSIGVDSGELVSGSIGAKGLGRLDYTVLGDVVNRAAWLASHAGRDQILIREELSQQLESGFECSSLGPRSLPGSSAPLRLHEVVLRREAVVPAADSTIRPPIRESAPVLAALNAASAKEPHSP